VAGEFGIPRAYGSYEDLLADPDIDAVYIPLPNQLHVPWATRAMDAGKQVLREKPLSTTIDGSPPPATGIGSPWPNNKRPNGFELACECDVRTAIVRPPHFSAPSGGQVERAGEPVEEVAATAQYLDHTGRDRTIRREFAGDQPVDARTRSEGEVDRSVPARHVQGGAVHQDQ
jgi:hypothetical protein